jgi:hypothetical protein
VDKFKDLQAWIKAFENNYQYNDWQWEIDADQIEYAIGQFKK